MTTAIGQEHAKLLTSSLQPLNLAPLCIRLTTRDEYSSRIGRHGHSSSVLVLEREGSPRSGLRLGTGRAILADKYACAKTLCVLSRAPERTGNA